VTASTIQKVMLQSCLVLRAKFVDQLRVVGHLFCISATGAREFHFSEPNSMNITLPSEFLFSLIFPNSCGLKTEIHNIFCFVTQDPISFWVTCRRSGNFILAVSGRLYC
jgi:hypothetical protein